MKAVLSYLLPAISIVLLFSGFAHGNDPWLKLRSENFALYGDAEKNDIYRAAFQLEKFREVIGLEFPAAKFEAPVPTAIVVFRSNTSLSAFLTTAEMSETAVPSGSFFREGAEGNYIVLSAEALKSDSLGGVYHQYLHFLIDNAIGKSRVPPWLYEGLAEYFEDFRIDENGIASYGRSRSKHSQWLTANKLISFDAFFNVDYYALRQQEKEGEGLFYAEAWAVTRFLMRDESRGRFAVLLEQLGAGKSSREAIAFSFEKSLAGFENSVKEQLSPIPFPGHDRVLKNTSEISASEITEAEVETLLGDLSLDADHLADAERHFEAALRLEPNSNRAISSLGLLRVKQFKYDEAESLGKKAIESGDEDYLLFYRYAYILSRRGMTDYGFVSGYNFADADKMRDALRIAEHLNPRFAPIFELFALVSFVRNDEIGEAFDRIGNALAIAPGNQSFLLRKAELLLRKEKFYEARKMVIEVLQNAAEPGLRLYAENTIQRIDSTEAQTIRIKSGKSFANDETVTETPMTDEEIARRRTEAWLDSIRDGLRKPGTGQKRIAGSLLELQCAGKQVIFIFKTETEILRLHANSLEGINLMSFNQNMFRAEIGCGPFKKENNAVVIYEEAPAKTSRVAGEVRSIEFVPMEFKLAVKN